MQISALTEFKWDKSGDVNLNSLTLVTDLAVAHGGTGASTLTDGGVVIGSGTGAVTVLGQATNGQLIIGSTGTDPVLASILSADASVTITAGAGSVDLAIAGGTTVGKTLTADSGGALTPTAGNWNILGGTGVTTVGSGSTVTIASDGGGFAWTTVTDATQALVAQNGYVGSRGTAITFTLPTTAVVGDTIEITNIGAGLPVIAQNASQLINYTASTTTTGVGGSLTATQQFSSITLVCTVTNTTFNVLASTGSWTIV